MNHLISASSRTQVIAVIMLLTLSISCYGDTSNRESTPFIEIFRNSEFPINNGNIQRPIRRSGIALYHRETGTSIVVLWGGTKDLEQIQSELADTRVEVNRLQRIQRVLPKLARRRELSQELELLGAISGKPVVILAEDFTDRRHKAVNGLETAQAIVGKATPRLDELQKQLEGLSINQELLDQTENIEDLHARLDGHKKALQDRPHLEAEG